MDDSKLREQLQAYGVNVGPVTSTTRGVLMKRLDSLKAATAVPNGTKSKATTSRAATSKSPVRKGPGRPKSTGPKLPDPAMTLPSKMLPGFTTKNKADVSLYPKHSIPSVNVETSLASNRILVEDSDSDSECGDHDTSANPILKRRSMHLFDRSVNTSFEPPSASPRLSTTGGSMMSSSIFSSIRPSFTTRMSSGSGDRTGTATLRNRMLDTDKAGYSNVSDERAVSVSRPETFSKSDAQYSNGAPRLQRGHSFVREYDDDNRRNVPTTITSKWSKKLKTIKLPSIGAHTSTYLMYGMVAMLAVIALLYGLVAYRSALGTGIVIVINAVSNTVGFFQNLALWTIVVLLGFFSNNYLRKTIFLIFLVVGIFVAVYFGVKYVKKLQDEKQLEIVQLSQAMVEDIRIHNENRGHPMTEALLRERAMTQSKATVADYNAAMKLVRNNPNIRSEIAEIEGEDFAALRYLVFDSTVPGRNWQGAAVARRAVVNPPKLSSCLKARNFFSKSIQDDPQAQEEIKNKILTKTFGISHIMHIGIDVRSTEGVVYIRCLSPEDAQRAYIALNGHWFDKGLVNVKYIIDEKYNERYPNTINLQVPMTMQNSRLD